MCQQYNVTFMCLLALKKLKSDKRHVAKEQGKSNKKRRLQASETCGRFKQIWSLKDL